MDNRRRLNVRLIMRSIVNYKKKENCKAICSRLERVITVWFVLCCVLWRLEGRYLLLVACVIMSMLEWRYRKLNGNSSRDQKGCHDLFSVLTPCMKYSLHVVWLACTSAKGRTERKGFAVLCWSHLPDVNSKKRRRSKVISMQERTIIAQLIPLRVEYYETAFA